MSKRYAAMAGVLTDLRDPDGDRENIVEEGDDICEAMMKLTRRLLERGKQDLDRNDGVICRVAWMDIAFRCSDDCPEPHLVQEVIDASIEATDMFKKAMAKAPDGMVFKNRFDHGKPN